jgi:drug/metabolite transporter (DMT)-like permease
MSRRGWVLFTVMGVIWGLPNLLIKVADGGVSVPVLVFARVFAGSLLLLPVAMRGGRLGALRPYLLWLGPGHGPGSGCSRCRPDIRPPSR